MDPVPLIKALIRAGFSITTEPGTYEILFERKHDKDPNITIRVYTSINQGTGRFRVGWDRIRVVLKAPRYNLLIGKAKFKRINRTGTNEGLAERTLKQCREAYKHANEIIKRRNHEQNQEAKEA